MRQRWHGVVVGLVGGALLAGLGAGCRGKDQASRTPHPPGFPARGQLLDDEALDFELPPPPRDAVAYEVRDPLRNGRTTGDKRRWIWIPEGTRISVFQGPQGEVGVRLPRGTKLWKEFHLRAPQGNRLIERRLLLKLEDSDDRNGWLMNGGWRFFAAHHLPAEADGVNGFANRLTVKVSEVDRWAYRPEQWMPTRAKSAATFVNFVGAGGEPLPYVFPGKVNCDLCHGGASGAYATAGQRPILAFGSHPGNLTGESLRALMKRGWIDAPAALLSRLQKEQRFVGPAGSESSAPAQPAGAVGDRVLAIFQNNCLSCHNQAPLAAARETAFALHPYRRYDLGELRRALSGRSSVMGSLSRPLLTPGKPEQSELWLRLRGEDARRRMPPAEGGVPEPDEELTRLVETWIKQLGQAEPG